ncbi:hypothetical protein AURDEDRAFT_62232 [Auricularia subglabra TFB-10046 SS5]|nr:hypothetical protein AURDEDRAFT_62232 [Auricularia subglabra TFB-10046 SS5]
MPRSSVPLHRTDTVPELPIPTNATDSQHEFAEDLCRVFVACNIAWNAARNAELRAFFAKWLPHLRVPDRRTLSGPILRVEKQKAVARVKSKVQGKLAMLQCDGWKNVARMPVITFMMTVAQQSYLLQSHNMFGQPKTGAKLWELTQLNVTSAKDLYGVETIGICTDDGPDGKCMRRLARENFSWWILVVCWAHQNQLMIGDLLRRCRRFKRLIDRAQSVIKWFMAHGTALSFLHDQQLAVPGTRRALMLLLPVISRWGAQYVSIARLLRLESAMRSVCYLRKAELLALRSQSDDDEHDSRAQETLNIVFEEAFWTELAKVKEHLEPLAISSLILQSPTLRLDQILLTLGNILYIISLPGEVFILAVLFNPYIRLAAFSDAYLSRASVRQMCMRVYRRLFRQEATLEFWSACTRYFDRQGRFSDELLSLDFLRDHAARNGTEIDLVLLWQDAQSKDTPGPDEVADQQLVSLAIRLLSVIGNSIACERNFSSFGITHTKLRNSLAVESTHDINFVRMDINARHWEAGLKPNRLKRRHGDAASSSASTVSSDDAEPAAADADSEDLVHAAQQLLAAGDGSDPLDFDRLLESSLPIEEPDPNEFTPPQYQKICLSHIFKYPGPGQDFPEDSPLRVFWKGAIKLLDEQERIHEAAQNLP